MTQIITSDHINKFHMDEDYKTLLMEIKSKLQRSRLKAVINVNMELIKFYFEVGKLIIEQQERSKWGDKLFEVLATDLNRSFPDTKGFLKTNLKNMRLFAMHYNSVEISQALPDQLTWTHHIVLLQNIDKNNLLKNNV